MDLRDIARQAIEKVQKEIHWKPGKDVQHLARRVERGHLSEDTSLDQYEAIIRAVVNDDNAEVFVFFWHRTPYPSVFAEFEGKPWLVMVSETGIMETAFVVHRLAYLEQEEFTRLATLAELMS